jgi:nitrite reductase (NO-forming)
LFLSVSAFVITVLAVGLISSLVIIEDSELAQGLNTEFTPSGKTKHVTLITNETVVQVAPDNALHPGGVMYNALHLMVQFLVPRWQSIKVTILQLL